MRELFKLVGKIALDGTVEVTKEMERLNKDAAKLGRTFANIGKDLTKFGMEFTKGVTLPVIALSAAAGKVSIDFESAFAGVTKTVTATDQELAVFRRGIRDMANDIPIVVEEIAGVAEAAGQLGINNENILSFTRVMSDMGVTTDLSANNAATALARLANITQMPQAEFDRLGSTVVALGNSLATTESEIVEMGLRLAGAGSQIGLTEAQILSIAGALSSVGIEAEAGGSAFSRVMSDMQLAVETGGSALDNFAVVSGLTVEQFKQAFQKDAAQALTAFIEGLSRAESSGTTAIKVLSDMGIEEIRMRDALLRAAGAGDLFSKSLALGSRAWEENIALTKEAEQRYATSESRLKIMWNRLKDLAITIGDVVVPAVLSFLDFFSPIIEGFKNLSPNVLNTIVSLAALAATFGPVLIVAGKLVSFVGLLIPLYTKLTLGQLSLNAAMKSNPVMLIVSAIYILITAGILLYQNWDTIKNFMVNAWDTIVYSVQQAVSFIKTLLFSYIKMWVDAINVVGQYIPGINKVLDFAKTTLQKWIDEEKNAIKYRSEAKTAADKEAQAIKEQEKALKNATKTTKESTDAKEEETQATVEQIEAAKKLKEEREKFETDWTDKLFQATSTRKELLEAEYQDAIAKAEKLGADKTAIEEYYKNRRLELVAEENQGKLDAQAALDQAIWESQQRDREREEAEAEANKKLYEAKASDIVGYIDAVNTGQKSLMDIIKEQVIALLNAEEIKIIAKIAAGIAAAWAEAPFTFGASLGWIPGLFSAQGVALGAIELAKGAIRGLAEGGLVEAQDGGIFANIGEGKEDEIVLPMETGADRLADNLMDRMTGSQMPAPDFAGGYGTANIFVDIDGKTFIRAIGQPLTDFIRIKSGNRVM